MGGAATDDRPLYLQNDTNDALFGGATALAVTTGGRGEDDAIRYLKGVSLHLYLLGYEFTGG